VGVTVREKDGAGWIFVNHQGKRKAKRVGVGDAGKHAARKAPEKIQAKLVLGDLSILEPKPAAKAAPTFRDVAVEWEQVKGPDLKRGTRIDYANIIRQHRNGAFGDLPITEVTGDRVEAWWVRLRNTGLSKKHVSTVRTILNQICRWAVSKELLTRNPVDRIAGQIGKAQGKAKKLTDYLTAEDLDTFLTTAERVCPKEYPIFLVMGTCGLRVGEAVGLQVGDLDSARLRIQIRRTVRRGYIDSPKSGEEGEVDVPATTMAVLERVKELRRVEAAVDGVEARWLFPSRLHNDRPITPEGIGWYM
jgi:integrase